MEYRACVEELLFSSQVQHMKSIRHHPGVSCYEHSVFVSYVAWYLADRWGADARTAARAGLLHDLYLYDPRTLPSYRQCFAHPVAAAENAAALCGGLTAREKNGYLNRHREVLEDHFLPAYQLLIDGLEALKGTGSNENGLCWLKGGKDYYRYLLRSQSGLYEEPDQIRERLQEQLKADSCLLYTSDAADEL